ncbi:hypothetical protein CL630_02660 [bacterium]|nr:hypothetical protein [bacterium]|tara:strand:- start:2043 stop:4067 length:2025 start_codon:yes stop_codon:yes gene_type:complete
MKQKQSKLFIYSVFHLNLAYSSIPENKLQDVVKQCYWPLLKIIEKTGAKIGIEATGYTLEKIQEIDPLWIFKLKKLIKEGKCEFVGSGYAQIIGPLIPSDVNAANLSIGNDVYELLLGRRPYVAFVNEQAYSASLVKHYLDAGYDTIMMEWNNPRKNHPEWKNEWQYYPQIVKDVRGRKINVLWNNSTAFQKFQRHVYGEINQKEYIEYLKLHIGKTNRFFPLYGSDTEVFDFRTGRYHNEASLVSNKEWRRIAVLFKKVANNQFLETMLPSEVIKYAEKNKNAFHVLTLESSEQPIPVKKREVYNITRWALAGRDSIGINTTCFEIYDNLKSSNTKDPSLWKELCFLWGSDFRTHIEAKKFKNCLRRLTVLLRISKALKSRKTCPRVIHKPSFAKASVKKISGYIIVNTPRVNITLNTQKGLSIDGLIFKKISPLPLIGVLQNGFYEEVTLAEDFFSGHTVVEIPMRPKITDLERVDEKCLKIKQEKNGAMVLSVIVKTGAGTIKKTVTVFADQDRVDLRHVFNFKDVYPASFRTAIMTINPEAFSLKDLYYGSHHGGVHKEIFPLASCTSIVCDLISHLISSRSAFGNTEGEFEIGDKEKSIIFKTDMGELAALPMMNFLKTNDRKQFFLRLLYSLGEYNETSLLEKQNNKSIQFSLSISGRNVLDTKKHLC